jgi:two-component system, chemotaxis family, sensor kinase CheA
VLRQGLGMDDLLDEFLTESNEHLELLDQQLVMFEQDPNNTDILRNIFRVVHTIKGTCGFLNLPRLEALAHAAESLMGQFRDGAKVTPGAVSLILATLDRIKAIMGALSQNSAEPAGEDKDLISNLEDMASAAVAPPSDMMMSSLAYQAPERQHNPNEATLDELERVFRETEGPGMFADAPVTPNATQPALERVQGDTPALKTTSAKATALLRDVKPSDEAHTDVRIAATQTLRVNVDTLEHLMTMVSELVLTRNQLLEISRRHEDASYKVPLQRLSHITAELQDGVMKTRMQPIGNAWTKLPRIVRDLAGELNKKIEFVTEGAETELDRQVLELIKDPLTHMIRNSSDHGIEMPAERRALGKPETGTIRLSAFHEGGTITIEVKDDGRGLNLPRIKRKIIEKGLATEAELEKMAEAQIMRFIFHPGFSTADQVTSVSGRGVGMDVVKSNVDAIGGTIEVSSNEGVGSTFSVKIPLTLAIVSALIVSACDQRFAIPQLVVRELVRVKQGSDHQIELIHGAPIIRLRDKLLPIVSLGNLMRKDEPGQAAEGFVVITQVSGRQFGILVDGVFHTEEIVVKPMSTKLRHIPLFSGNTILGDGAVVLILDPNGVARMISNTAGDAEQQISDEIDENIVGDEQVTMLIFRAGGDRLKAIPLSIVTRLEDVDASKIEYSSGRPVLQYRGKLMPIVPADENVELRTSGQQPLIIFSDGERSMGLAVDAIIDIVAERMAIELPSQTETDVVGSAVVRGRATEIVDVAHYLPLAYPDWLQGQALRSTKVARHALLVDGSDFFREMLVPVLKAGGWRVTAVATAQAALSAVEADQDMVVIIDLDAPAPSGLALARTLAVMPTDRMIQMIGRATFASASMVSEAREAGIADIVAKFDRRGLISALNAMTYDSRQAA